MTNPINRRSLTPADQGIIAATLDDARRQGLGDDEMVDQVYFALYSEAGFSHFAAKRHAYNAIHNA